MPFTRLQELSKLVGAIDNAMARHDEQGLGAIRDLLPALHETVDAVNAALGEVEGLLFEGLRDEAIALHDPEFPALAARLNLQDRAGWPEVEQFFASEGIGPPPQVDFDTLSALESAHAELEPLGRTLDKLRRMALERAPLGRRLAALRKLRELDPTKPVWTELIAAHEQVRAGELKDAVRQALASRDPEAIAALHGELTASGWTVPVPKELVRATHGAEAWLRLRDVVAEAEAAVAALEAWYAQAAVQPPTLEMVDDARRLRQRWEEARDAAAGCRAALAESPTVSGLVRDEGIVGRIDSLPARAQPVLEWLDVQDARDDVGSQFAHACQRLEEHVALLPHRRAEAAWLANVHGLQNDLSRLCRELPDLSYPEELRARVEGAVAAVQSRGAQRRKMLVGAAAAAGVVLVLVIASAFSCSRHSRQLAVDRMMLEKIRLQALAGNFVELPKPVVAIEGRHPGDEEISDAVRQIAAAVKGEENRRGLVQEKLALHAAIVATARSKFAERKGMQRLDAWPDDVPAAAKAWRDARGLGGDPGRRKEAGGHMHAAAFPPENCPEARQAIDKEEREIVTAEESQKQLEYDFRRAATEAFSDEERAIRAEVDSAAAGKDAARARLLLGRLLALEEQAGKDKCNMLDALIDGAVRRRVAPAEADAARDLEMKLRELIK